MAPPLFACTCIAHPLRRSRWGSRASGWSRRTPPGCGCTKPLQVLQCASPGPRLRAGFARRRGRSVLAAVVEHAGVGALRQEGIEVFGAAAGRHFAEAPGGVAAVGREHVAHNLGHGFLLPGAAVVQPRYCAVTGLRFTLAAMVCAISKNASLLTGSMPLALAFFEFCIT